MVLPSCKFKKKKLTKELKDRKIQLILKPKIKDKLTHLMCSFDASSYHAINHQKNGSNSNSKHQMDGGSTSIHRELIKE
jgi:hypothetical protein